MRLAVETSNEVSETFVMGCKQWHSDLPYMGIASF